MRGVQLPAGSHTVEFRFTLPHKPLDITLAAMGLAVLFSAFLLIATRQEIRDLTVNVFGMTRLAADFEEIKIPQFDQQFCRQP